MFLNLKSLEKVLQKRSVPLFTMAALKKDNKPDKPTDPGPATPSPTQNQTISGTQNANKNNTPAISKLPQTKGDAANKSPAKNLLLIESKEHFENILKEAGDKLVMVEFFAMWCGPCKHLGLKLEELAELYKDRVVIVKVDVDTLEELAIEHDVTDMPAFMIMKNNTKVEQFSGSKVEQLEAAFEKYLGKAKE